MEASPNEHSRTVAQLQQEYRSYAERLASLQGCSYLSEDEQLEETRLKKLKLHAKDRLNALGAYRSDEGTRARDTNTQAPNTAA
jgi:hypothetical protein